MKMDEIIKKYIIDELRFISNMMKESDDLLDSIFYFSAAYGVFDKVMRQNYSEYLLFTEEVLQLSYIQLSNFSQDIKLQSIIKDIDIKATLKEIASNLNEIAIAIENDRDYIDNLIKIKALAYQFTAPGIYLKKRFATK
ncbi:MAG: hypothetical protein ACP5L4_06360 [Thermoplasmata archaeon]